MREEKAEQEAPSVQEEVQGLSQVHRAALKAGGLPLLSSVRRW
jgi:hypothetical protein